MYITNVHLIFLLELLQSPGSQRWRALPAKQHAVPIWFFGVRLPEVAGVVRLLPSRLLPTGHVRLCLKTPRPSSRRAEDLITGKAEQRAALIEMQKKEGDADSRSVSAPPQQPS